MVASLIGRFGSSTFRLSTTAVSMSLTGSCFSSESAPRLFHHGIRGRGGTIYWAALPSDERRVQATKRTHLDLYAPAIQAMLRDLDIRLMNVTQAEAMARLFTSVNRLVLPQGVIDLEKNIPPSDVNLIGSTTAFVVRKDLHPELKYLLAQTVKEVHSGGGVFHRGGEFPSLTDPELPMAQEALDYYRNMIKTIWHAVTYDCNG